MRGSFWVGLALFLLVLTVGGGIWFWQRPSFVSPLSFLAKEVDYHPYSFENLAQREYFPSQVSLEKVLGEEEKLTSYLFSYSADGRRITGMAKIPKEGSQFPVAILIRGWVDEKIYQTGMGTEKMAEFLAEKGFLTLAPDLLGYGDSDPAFSDMLQTRFFRPITIITLLNSLKNLPQADASKVAIWAHSNGGQIALSVLEITGREIPTSLWAPVGVAFPDSVLYFANEMEDGGKRLREIISRFEEKYDPPKFSTATYLERIKAPLIIHQGLEDEAIPPEWTIDLVNQLRQLGKEVTYFEYPDENHNFNLGKAPEIRNRDEAFFKKHLGLLGP